ncbi:hypothetical protein HMPREF3033_01771 [Veillonellaceae bacterium DNF00751]|uniref:Uncharacterized protein n=1 Tax=Megasphaera lornae TaxID=1000568 RepID=D3LV08_9FIRM|nr:hypothetical protein HMPREF0889_0334 [Megasphaera genomosp. type_1 str. 28L]EGL39868.1 hypothetical protein HMPREF1039_0346 [Megasphaera lornae]KXB89442.1 hypothetical protein HMPREF3033_01771 [Veillonellaceae bacterium DNF00751]MUP50095.1 hypothetical protein [Veillonellaceae bacterium M1-70]
MCKPQYTAKKENGRIQCGCAGFSGGETRKRGGQRPAFYYNGRLQVTAGEDRSMVRRYGFMCRIVGGTIKKSGRFSGSGKKDIKK